MNLAVALCRAASLAKATTDANATAQFMHGEETPVFWVHPQD